MKKDFSTIREMANKKLLNGEQKKNLHKLFENKIDIAITETRKQHTETEKKAENEMLEKMSKTKIVKECINTLTTADENISKYL